MGRTRIKPPLVFSTFESFSSHFHISHWWEPSASYIHGGVFSNSIRAREVSSIHFHNPLEMSGHAQSFTTPREEPQETQKETTNFVLSEMGVSTSLLEK